MDKTVEIQGVETRRKIYNFLIEFMTKNGYAPSVREICDGTNLKSTSSVHHHLMILDDMGKIHMENNKTRAIKLIGYEFKKVEK